ncbi:MAG TPA: hypothetical protein DCZ91_06330 [Lachnospiraceae bacterium]|nr:hypothetical protein [Lachnospiraceae bacterium]
MENAFGNSFCIRDCAACRNMLEYIRDYQDGRRLPPQQR